MNLEKRIASFVELGTRLANFEEDEYLAEAASLATVENPWFTADFVRYALWEWSRVLEPRALTNWLMPYRDRIRNQDRPKTVAVVMAGNVPLAGFHDMLCVLLSGHRILAKPSSQDKRLPVAIGQALAAIAPEWAERIMFTEGRLGSFDSVIATGSDNTSRYFEYYFGRYPHIIRRNRNSAAILTGDETEYELRELALDIFLYFGLGCRSVSTLFLPQGFDLERFREPFSRFAPIINHNKYRNNVDYHKSVMLVNRTPFIDGGFYLLVQSQALSSPVSVIHYEFYRHPDDVAEWINRERDHIQCVVGRPGVPGCTATPGTAQSPGLDEYADNTDTLAFLTEKN